MTQPQTLTLFGPAAKPGTIAQRRLLLLCEELRPLAERLGTDFAFSHVTAALLMGWPVPWRARVGGAVHIATTTDAGRRRLPGVIGHRGLELRGVVFIHGLPVVAPADTWVDLGELIGAGKPWGFDAIIAAGDQALNLVDNPDVLAGALAARTRPRGKLFLTQALPLLRPGSQSGPETQARLVLTRAGLPMPDLNVAIHDADGHYLGSPDLAWRARRTIGECQGEEAHNDPDAVAFDESRFAGFTDNGWTVEPIRSTHLHVPQERVDMLRRFARHLDFPEECLRFSEAMPRFFPPLTVPSRARHDPKPAVAWLVNNRAHAGPSAWCERDSFAPDSAQGRCRPPREARS